jgi:hypothetical protein
MAAHAAAGVIHQEGFDEHLQGVLLPLGTGIGRVTAGVESAFVADTDATGVVTLGMCTRKFYRPATLDAAVSAHVEVVADAAEAARTVGGFKGFTAERPVFARGGAMHYDEIDGSHILFLKNGSSTITHSTNNWITFLIFFMY